MPFDLDSNFWSAIVGAVVGGLISLGLQVIANSNARRERLDSKREADRALAYSLAFKVVKITNGLGNLKNHVDECKALVENEAQKPLAWTYIKPIINLPEEVRFSAEEMATQFTVGEDDIFNHFLNLEPVYNSIMPAWREYRQLRESFSNSIDQEVDYQSGTSEVAINLKGVHGLRMFELNSLAEELIARSERDFAEALATQKAITQSLNAKHRIGIAVEIDTKKVSQT